jgi:nicotinamidase-related amidase
MLIDPRRSQLLVIDVQERLMPAVQGAESVAANAGILIRSAEHLAVPITVTEQYPKGLGHTVAEVAARLPESAAILPKTAFSGAGESAVALRIAGLRAEGRDQAILCGAEAHVCVLQTALGLRAEGMTVFVVADAVSSRSPHSVAAAEARLVQAGCVWVTTEMVVFEWLERAGTEEFRALAPLIRETPPRLPPR